MKQQKHHTLPDDFVVLHCVRYQKTHGGIIEPNACRTYDGGMWASRPTGYRLEIGGRMDHSLPKRKHPRLKSDVYDRDGMCFITLCTRERSACLSVLRASADHTEVCLTEIGETVQRYLLRIGEVYPDVCVDTYVIMPDHVHLLLRICGKVCTPGGGWSPAVHTRMVKTIRSFKTIVSKQLGFSIWQTSFYDRIVRDRTEYLACKRYILENPARWMVKYGGIPD